MGESWLINYKSNNNKIYKFFNHNFNDFRMLINNFISKLLENFSNFINLDNIRLIKDRYCRLKLYSIYNNCINNNY